MRFFKQLRDPSDADTLDETSDPFTPPTELSSGTSGVAWATEPSKPPGCGSRRTWLLTLPVMRAAPSPGLLEDSNDQADHSDGGSKPGDRQREGRESERPPVWGIGCYPALHLPGHLPSR
jgi:hypothetical protein